MSEEREKRSTVEIQTAAKAFTAAHERAFEALKAEWATLDSSLQAVDPAGEWASYKGLKGAYVDPETKLRDPSLIAYPHQGHESAEAKWTGTLERKKRFAKSYVEVKVVVTASGFLHTFPLKSDSDDPKKALPDLSLFLPVRVAHVLGDVFDAAAVFQPWAATVRVLVEAQGAWSLLELSDRIDLHRGPQGGQERR